MGITARNWQLKNEKTAERMYTPWIKTRNFKTRINFKTLSFQMKTKTLKIRLAYRLVVRVGTALPIRFWFGSVLFASCVSAEILGQVSSRIGISYRPNEPIGYSIDFLQSVLPWTLLMISRVLVGSGLRRRLLDARARVVGLLNIETLEGRVALFITRKSIKFTHIVQAYLCFSCRPFLFFFQNNSDVAFAFKG